MVNIKQRTRLFSIAAWCIVASYTIICNLKFTHFIQAVGSEYIPIASICSTFFIIIGSCALSHFSKKRTPKQLFTITLSGYASILLLYAVIFFTTTATTLSSYITPWVSALIWYGIADAHAVYALDMYWLYAHHLHEPHEGKRAYGTYFMWGSIGSLSAPVLNALFIYCGIISCGASVVASSILLMVACGALTQITHTSSAKIIDSSGQPSEPLFKKLHIDYWRYLLVITLLPTIYQLAHRILEFHFYARAHQEASTGLSNNTLWYSALIYGLPGLIAYLGTHPRCDSLSTAMRINLTAFISIGALMYAFLVPSFHAPMIGLMIMHFWYLGICSPHMSTLYNPISPRLLIAVKPWLHRLFIKGITLFVALINHTMTLQYTHTMVIMLISFTLPLLLLTLYGSAWALNHYEGHLAKISMEKP